LDGVDGGEVKGAEKGNSERQHQKATATATALDSCLRRNDGKGNGVTPET
jgi:hypothetical protein